jgi:cytochrome c
MDGGLFDLKGKETLIRTGGIFQAVILPAIIMFTTAILPVVCWAGVAPSAGKASSKQSPGEKLVSANDCAVCHAVDQKVVGPAYRDVAKKYRGRPNAVEKLSQKIKQGGFGDWGQVPMTPHPDLTAVQLRQMVAWILSQGEPAAKRSATAAGNPAQSAAASRTYDYPLANGTAVKLDFPLFVEGLDHKVTKDIFSGYEMYNSYCYRCHGQDATGSEIAPDLRHSLNVGMTRQQFFSAAMAGRAEKGMPSWAGFLSAEEVKQIYEYVKGRSLDLVPVGRPPSETD